MTNRIIYRYIIYLTISIVSIITILNINLTENDSLLAKYYKENRGDVVKLKDIFPGNWDVACLLTELMNPAEVVDELGYHGYAFSEDGSSFRKTIYDGETGILLIDFAQKRYAIFLVFDRDHVAIIAANDSADGCLPFQNSILKKSPMSDSRWTYLKLEK